MNPEDFSSNSPGHIVRTLQGYWAFVPGPLPPDLEWTPGLIALLSEADRSMGELAGLGRSLLNPHLLVRPFMRREAVLSSRIEGTQASLTDLYIYEAVQMPLFELAGDVHEVQNYVRAMEYGLERLETLPVSLRLIREIHAQLLEGVRGEHWKLGEFRHTQNWIGPQNSTLENATFVPPPPDEMLQALTRLEAFIHASSDLPPLIRLGLIHYQFEAIHPFSDGNGRTGRILNLLYLVSQGLLSQPVLYLSRYIIENKDDYYYRLTAVTQRAEWKPWLMYMMKAIQYTASYSNHLIDDIILQMESTLEYGKQNLKWYNKEINDVLFTQPYIKPKLLGEILNRTSRTTLTKYMNDLMRTGILTPKQDGREVFYLNHDLIRILEG
ncbi:MAG: Fic family protein [Anaerolineales bacterium]|nr:Fic family protein [Anaerolineales bacterium]